MGFSSVFGGYDPYNLRISSLLVTQISDRRTHNHFFVLADPNSFPFHHLQVFQTAQDVMLNIEVGLHAELSAFLDCERFRLQSFNGARCIKIDGNVFTSFDFQGE